MNMPAYIQTALAIIMGGMLSVLVSIAIAIANDIKTARRLVSHKIILAGTTIFGFTVALAIVVTLTGIILY